MKRFKLIIKLWYLFLVLGMVALLWKSYVSLQAQRPQHWGGNSLTTEPNHEHSHDHDHGEMAVLETAEPLNGVPCTLGFAGPYPCKDVDLLAFLPTNSLVGSTGADIWGWTDPLTGKEYAIQSHSNATSFTDISDPVNPVFVGYLPAPVANILWRDVKVYNNHAYIVGDGNLTGPHGLQIFDLTQLREATLLPIVFEETARYTEFGRAHNVAINEETGVAYVVGSTTCSGGLHMAGLQDPTNPAFLGCFSDDDYTHDAQCVIYRGPDAEHQGKEICFNSNEDTLTIVDVSNKSAPVMLARQTYTGVGYTHQGWLTEDQAFFVLGDELDELNNSHNTHSYIWDVSNLEAPVHSNTYVGPTTAIDHNLYIRDHFVFESNYTAGLRILDAGDIANGNLAEIAYFDTHPSNDAAAFAGTWSNYPFFGSGVVIVSNIEDGLYILKPHLPDSEESQEGKATGGGWLQTNEDSKLNFGFSVEKTADGLQGDLQLNDKTAAVKIRISEVTRLGGVNGRCGSLVDGPNALEFWGNGTFNGAAGARFRVCVEDNGEPGRGHDRFYLECLEGCDYKTGDRTPDDVIDGGNIQVQRHAGDDEGDAGVASTLILDPVLLTEGLVGQVQLFTVTVYDQYQRPMSGADVTLTRTTSTGSTEAFPAVTDLTGTAVFSLVNLTKTTEYIATSGSAESNTIEVSSLLD